MDLQKSAVKVFSARIVGSVVNFAGIIAFANGLGPKKIGVFFLFQAIVGLMAVPGDFGIRSAIEKRVSEGVDLSTTVSTAVAVKAVIILVLSLGILLFRDYINNYLGANIASYVVVALILREAAHIPLSALRGELRVGQTASVQLLHPLLWVGVGLPLMYLGYGLFAPIYATLVAFAGMLVYGSFRTNATITRPSYEHARSLVAFSKYDFVSAIGGLIYQWMDVLVLGFFVGQAAVGAYEVAWRVTSVVLLLGQSISTVVFPQVSSWEAEKAYDRIEYLIPNAISPSLSLAIPALFGTVLLAPEILSLVFGAEYVTASLALTILMVEKVLQSTHVILGRSLQGIDQADIAAKIAVVALLLNVVLNLAMVPVFGLAGAATATAVSFAFNTVAHAYSLNNFIAVQIPWKDMRWYLASSIGMFIVLKIVKLTMPITTLPRLAGIVVSGGVVYSIFVLTSTEIRTRTRQLVAQFI